MGIPIQSINLARRLKGKANKIKDTYQDPVKEGRGTREFNKERMEKLCSDHKLHPPPVSIVHLTKEDTIVDYIFPGLEEAYWDYLDHWKSFKFMEFNDFAKLAFDLNDELEDHKVEDEEFTKLMQTFNGNKLKVEVAGAVLYNKSRTKCLLVSPKWAKNSREKIWSPPQGKRDMRLRLINNEMKPRIETLAETAMREVEEEIGIKIVITDETPFAVARFRDKFVQLYMIMDVDENDPNIEANQNVIDTCIWMDVRSICPKDVDVPLLEPLFEDPEKLLYFEDNNGVLYYGLYQVLPAVVMPYLDSV